jgi:hypothetical protein
VKSRGVDSARGSRICQSCTGRRDETFVLISLISSFIPLSRGVREDERGKKPADLCLAELESSQTPGSLLVPGLQGIKQSISLQHADRREP